MSAAPSPLAPPRVPDPLGAGHALRVTRLALALARALEAPAAAVEAVRAGGPLHDVGKVDVDPAILRKPGPLDPLELAAMRRHPIVGATLVAQIRSLRHAVGCVLHHHERWDGLGYPDGLEGATIPYEARIVAVADAYDAMTSDRPYRAALAPEDALLELRAHAGSQFDPIVVQTFLAVRASPTRRASSASA